MNTKYFDKAVMAIINEWRSVKGYAIIMDESYCGTKRAVWAIKGSQRVMLTTGDAELVEQYMRYDEA